MSIARKILSNTIYQILGKAGLAVLGLAVIKIATNYLSVKGYGEYVMIYEFLAFFAIAADMGIFTIAVKEMSKDETQIPKLIGNIISMRTALCLLTMGAAVVAVFMIPSYQGTHIAIGVAIASITTFLTIINGTISSVLQTKLQMGYASIAVIIGKMVSVAIMAYVVFFGFPQNKETGFYLLIMAGTFGNITMTMVTDHYVRKITPITYRFDFDLWKDVFIKTLPYGLALILNTLYFRMNSLFISFYKGQEEVGIYAVAMRILEQLTVLPLYFMNSVLPVLTKSLQEKNDKYKNIIRYSFDFLAAMALPMAIGGSVLSASIVSLISAKQYLSHPGFYGSDVALQILVLAVLFNFLNILFNFILIALGKQVRLLYINAACVIFAATLDFIVVPLYGFRGATFTSVLNELFILLGSYFTVKYYLKFSLNFKNLFKIIFSASVMGVALYLLEPIAFQYFHHYNILPLTLIGAGIYVFMLFATKAVNKEMIALLKKNPPKEEINTMI